MVGTLAVFAFPADFLYHSRPMIPDYFAIVGAALGSLGGFYYLYETAVGKVQPNRVTWLLWGLFPMIVFVAQRVQGVANLSWVTFVAGFNPLLIVLVSFINKKAYWQSKPRDYLLMAAAIVGIILWAITKEPNLAILFSLIADMLASLPTVIKAYQHPETESWVAYAISAVGFGVGVLAIQTFTFENYAFISYIFVINILLAYFASRK
ncbi:MAG: hypothetical protein KC445_18570 [Anaerolineales bacterium]|nr:hypothetical protein [Anaerolineales bacterium]